MKSHAPISILEYEIVGENKKRIISPSIKAEIELKLSNPKGKVVFNKKIPFRSFVSNFAYMLNYAFTGTSLSNKIKTTANTNATATTHTADVKEGIPVGNVPYYGIWIGNVTNNSGISGLDQNANMGSDIAFADYNLNTLFTDIVVVTDVVYQATTITFNSNGYLNINRAYINSRTTSVYVSEIGLVGKTNNNEYILLARDRFTDGTNSYVEVPADYVLDISYKFSVSAVSGFVKNFLGYLSSEFNGGDSIASLQDQAGGYYTVDFTAARTQKDLMAAASENNYGLLLGGSVGTSSSGSFSLSANSFKLTNKLTNTYLTHGATIALNTSDLTFTNNYSMFGVKRDFTNVSDTDAVYVYEAGLFVKHTTTAKYYMMSRLLTTGSGVPYLILQPGKILRIKYYLAFPLDEIQVVN